MTNHGLMDEDLETIRAVLADFSDEITKVDLFGSRATGNYRRNSDVDLVVHGSVRDTTIDRLWTLFNESNLPFSVDVASYDSMTNRPLKKHVDAVGKRLFSSREIREGRRMAAKDRKRPKK